jgi:hypothetical protein
MEILDPWPFQRLYGVIPSTLRRLECQDSFLNLEDGLSRQVEFSSELFNMFGVG